MLTQTAFAHPPSNLLGNTTNTLHAARKPSRNQASRAARSDGISNAKAVAYTLRQEAGRLLFDQYGGAKQKFRVCHCGRSLAGNFLQVWRAPDGSKAKLSGAMMCGSAWTCPICAFRIAGERQRELESSNVAWNKAGGLTYLLTMTFPHEAGDDLRELLHDFGKASTKLRNSRTWKKLLGTDGAAGCLGTVTSLEVTHGANGWHPHRHMLLFVRRPLAQSEIDALTKEWVGQLLKAGLGDRSKLSDMMAHALDVRGGEDAAAYITKYGREEMWGMSREVTADVAKEAKGGQLKPFGLLRRSVDERETDAERARCAARFVEFAEAFHGKRLLTWSPGLKAWFGIDESDDEQIAQDDPDSDATQAVGVLTADQWKIILSRNAIAELERFAAQDCINHETGQSDLDGFVDFLASLPKKSGGWFMSPMKRRFIH